MPTYHLYTDPVGIFLILYSVLCLALIVERILSWRKLKRSSKELEEKVKEILREPSREKYKEVFRGSEAPLGWVMEYVLKHEVTDSPETVLLLLEDGLEDVGKRLKKNLIYLASLAGTAPFLGLLGTVLGIMNTFTSIMKEGFGGPAVISAGIAQALQTTAAGLVIAIPAFIAYNIFNNRANDMLRELKRDADRLLVSLGDL